MVSELFLNPTMAKNNNNPSSTPQSSRSNFAGTATVADPSQNPASPYYLHPSENPTVFTIKTTLRGPNYHSWAHAIRRAMISKNKYGFLTCTISQLDSFHPFYLAWERCNTTLHSWISIPGSPVPCLLPLPKASTPLKALLMSGATPASILIFAWGDHMRIGKLQHQLYAIQ